jgi:glycosyltransferase involved in cell wall biosynthesis
VNDTLDVAERSVFGSGGRFVGMCYDVIPVDHPEWLFPPDPEGFRRYLGRLARVSSRVMCISQCTRRDLVRHEPSLRGDRSPVIRLGADAASSGGPEEDAFAAALFGGEPYAIYCATVDRRKNHQVLYRAMRELARAGIVGNIVFVGRMGSGVDDLVDCLRHDRTVAGRIAHVTDCDDAHLGALYRHAACAVYPSLYEGWGLGVTEALAHETPCLIASGSSLGEAGLGVCRELHPLRTGEWVAALVEYFAEPPVLPSLDLPTWASAADELLEVAAS